MVSHHFISVIQVATIVAELADEEEGMETVAKDVVEMVVAGALLIPPLPTFKLSAFKLLVSPPSIRASTVS